MKKTKSDWKQEFKEQVNSSHIKYDFDGGHAYSIIEHPLMREISDLFDDDDELLDFSNEWLCNYDDCPPCEIVVNDNGSVSSGCGCHDLIDTTTEDGKEEVEGIIIDLLNFHEDKDLQLL